MLDLFKASQNKKYFFENFAVGVTNWRQKLVEKNSTGKEVLFTEKDKEEIKKGLQVLFEQMLKA